MQGLKHLYNLSLTCLLFSKKFVKSVMTYGVSKKDLSTIKYYFWKEIKVVWLKKALSN